MLRPDTEEHGRPTSPEHSPATHHQTPRATPSLPIASAIAWARTAVFIGVATDALASYGVAGMFLHPQVYAFAVWGAGAAVLQQVALHLGPLSVSQPLIVVFDPIATIILSVWLFGERLTGNLFQLAVAFIASAVVAVGVVVLSIATPVHIEGSVRFGCRPAVDHRHSRCDVDDESGVTPSAPENGRRGRSPRPPRPSAARLYLSSAPQ